MSFFSTAKAETDSGTEVLRNAVYVRNKQRDLARLARDRRTGRELVRGSSRASFGRCRADS